MAREGFGDVVKAVVDIVQGVMAMGGEFHSEEEAVLMTHEHSKREDTWGINLYPQRSGDEFIEFDSMINIKPAFGNRSRNVEDQRIKEKIAQIVFALISS